MKACRTKNWYQNLRPIRRWAAAAVVAAAGLLLLAGQVSAARGPWVDERLNPAEIEAAYGSAGDAVDLDTACQLLLQLTNDARQQAGLAEVEWSDLAAQVAQTQANEMVERRLVGHYDAAGRTCELRFNLAGGTDQIVENTAYYEIQHDVYLTPQLVHRVEEHWEGSTSHRANLLDAAHTHFGAGFAVRRLSGVTRVAAVGEFVNDYGDYEALPRRAARGDTLEVSGRLDPQRAKLCYLGLGVADPPRPIAPGQVQRAGYDQPKVVLAMVPRQQPAQIASGVKFVRSGVEYDARTGEFSAQVWLDPDWPTAAYYVTVWAQRPGAERQVSLPEKEQVICVMAQVILVD